MRDFNAGVVSTWPGWDPASRKNHTRSAGLALLVLLIWIGPANAVAQSHVEMIGVGLEAPEEGSRSRAFVDLGRVFRPFTRLHSSDLAPVDRNGWPESDAEAVLFDIRPVPAWMPPIDDPEKFQPDWSGTYSLRFEGQATVTPTDGGIAVTEMSFDAGTNISTANLHVPKGAGLLVLSFTSTRRTPASDLNTGFTNLRLIRPGYAPDTTQVFTNEYLSAIAPFRVLRFMGFTATNDRDPGYFDSDNVTHWADRHVPGDATQQQWGKKKGFAWEYAIQIANLTCKDIWVNIPASADDDYVMNLAQLLHDTLDPSLRIYIEHSNEVWNPLFKQYLYNQQAAEMEVRAGGSNLANDGLNDTAEWGRRRHARRLIEYGRIFQGVFGEGAIRDRIRLVYAWWTIFPEQYRAVLGWVQRTYGDPGRYLYAVAQTHYFNDQKSPPSADPAGVLAAMRADSDDGRRYTIEIRSVADAFGLHLFAYEGGPDNGGGSTVNIGNRILANRDPAMKDIMLHDLRDNWFPLGGELHVYLELCSAYSRWGCWGQTEDIMILDTPKLEAIQDLVNYPSRLNAPRLRP